MAPNTAYGSLTSQSSSTYTPIAPSAAPSAQYGSLTSQETSPTSTQVSQAPTTYYGSLYSRSSSVSTSDPATSAAPPNSYGSLVSSYMIVSVTSTSTKPGPSIHISFKEHDRQIRGDFQRDWYFLAMYLPSIIAIIIKEIWSSVGSSAKLMEPFYRLHRPKGATVAESLCTEYLASALSMSSIRSVFTGNFHLLLIVVANICMSILAPLAAESNTVAFLGQGTDATGQHYPDNPAWLVSTILVRVLQAILSLISILAVLLIMVNARRSSGLSANPTSIASIATLLNSPDTVKHVQNISPNASVKAICRSNAQQRYILATYQDDFGRSKHGLIRMNDLRYQETQMMLSEPQNADEEEKSSMKRSMPQKIADVFLIFLIVGLAGVVIGYRIDLKSDGFNNFFNYAAFGPRFILSLSATIITVGISNIEQEMRRKLSYRRLAAKHAVAKTTILRTVNGTALSNLLPSLWHGDLFHSFVALTTVLGGVLTIAVAGIPLSGASIMPAFYASVYVTLSICTLMLTVVVSMFVWRARNASLRIPQDPNGSIIHVLMSLCNDGNRVRSMFESLEDTSDDRLKKHCRTYDGRYWAGWTRGADGRLRWCVDREGDATLIG